MGRQPTSRPLKPHKFKKIKNFGRLIKFFAVASLLFSLVFSLLNAEFFKIQSVETGWDRDDFSDPTVNEFFGKQFLQKNIFLLLPNQKLLLQNLPESIKKFSMNKILPHSLRVNLETRQPILFLSTLSENLKSASISAIIEKDGLTQNKSGPISFWSDDEGFLFNQRVSSLSALPKIFLEGETIETLKGKITTEFFFRFFLEYRRLNQQNDLPRLNILTKLNSHEIIARLENGTYLILPNDGNPEDLITSLNLILSKYTIEGRRLKKVDLRFKNPVVEFN